MFRLRNYIFIVVLVYFLTLLGSLPASIVGNQLDKGVGERFQLISSTGTIWAGRVVFLLDGGRSDLVWDMRLARLLFLQMAADVQLKTAIVDAFFYVQYGPGGLLIKDLRGVLHAAALGQTMKKSGVSAEINQDVYIRDVAIQRKSKQFSIAQGRLEWAGGLVKNRNLPDGQIESPALRADVSKIDSGVAIRFYEQGNSSMLAEVDISHDGRAHLKLRERVADFINVPSQLKTGDPDSVMFEIKQQVF